MKLKWNDSREIAIQLEEKYPEKDNLNLIHYTLGTPCFKEYSESSLSKYWKKSYKKLLDGIEN